ncbi:MAG: 5' nucleotidase, NT5C type [Nitrosopumilaceae archaeon]
MTAEKLKIGLDVDGVLADVIHTWLDYNNRMRKPISKEEISEWDFWKKHQIDKYDFYKELSLCWQTWYKIPSTEENLYTTTSVLSRIGEVYIVTAREEYTHTYVKSWLSSQKITYKNYVGVVEGLEKTKLNYDIFIDDSPINAKSMLDAGKSVILYTQPWNLSFNDPRAKRIFQLKDVIHIIKALKVK